MNRLISLLFVISLFVNINAIDFGDQYRFNVQALIGKRIIIPTYNGGNNMLRFAYNISTLKSKKFTYKNYYSSPILGQPIKVLDYKIFDEGKKKETLCLIVEHNNTQCVLRFPCNPEYTEYEDFKINDLFFRNNGIQKSYKDIDLKYYLADEIEQYNDLSIDSFYYLVVKDDMFSGRKYQYKGLSFVNYGLLVENSHRQVPRIKGSYSSERSFSNFNDLDRLCAVLQKDKDEVVYIKIREDEVRHEYGNTIELTSLNQILLSDFDYKKGFIKDICVEKINNYNDTLVGKNFYMHFDDNKNPNYYVCKKDQRHNFWNTYDIHSLNDRYIDIKSIKQIKTIVDNQDKYYLYAVGVLEGTNDSIAIPLKDSLMSCLHDGLEHKHTVGKEEAQRQMAELKQKEIEEKEEKEYKAKIIKRFGLSNAKLIMDGRVKIGFTKDMCIESWGEPDMINTTITRTKRWEQWVYGYNTFLYFDGNRLVVIQN